MQQDLASNPKCPFCNGIRLLKGTLDSPGFDLPNPKFRITVFDSPSVLLRNGATACFDCGNVWATANLNELRRCAVRWLKEDAKRHLGLE